MRGGVVCSQASLTCAALLLRSGAPTEDCVDQQGEGLLHRAVRYGSDEFIRLWFKQGGNMALGASSRWLARASRAALCARKPSLCTAP